MPVRLLQPPKAPSPIVVTLSGIVTERSFLHKRIRIAYVILASLFVVSVTWVFTCSKWPIRQGVKVRVFNPMRTYKKNGELLNFVRGFYYVMIDKPEGYSTAACKELMETLGYESDTVDSKAIQDSLN